MSMVDTEMGSSMVWGPWLINPEREEKQNSKREGSTD